MILRKILQLVGELGSDMPPHWKENYYKTAEMIEKLPAELNSYQENLFKITSILIRALQDVMILLEDPENINIKSDLEHCIKNLMKIRRGL